MLDGLYWEYLYNDGSDKRFICPGGEEAVGPCPVAPADRNILYENRLLGLPRLVVISDDATTPKRQKILLFPDYVKFECGMTRARFIQTFRMPSSIVMTNIQKVMKIMNLLDQDLGIELKLKLGVIMKQKSPWETTILVSLQTMDLEVRFRIFIH